MKAELVQAAATLATVALQKRVSQNFTITEESMQNALLLAMRAVHGAQLQWEKENLDSSPDL